MLIERYNEVKKHVEEACKRVGRDPREVTVIAVSKTKPLEMVKVIVDNKEKIEGKEDPEFTYTMEGDVVQGDSLGITLTRDEGEKAGIYTIHATLSNKNYEAEITEGVFTIKPSDKPTPGRG